MANAFCNTYRGDLLAGRARLATGQTGHRCALFTSATPATASLDAYGTAPASTGNEVANGNGYATGGELITIPGSMPSSGTGQSVAYCDFDDTTWSSSSITARWAIVYDDNATTPTANAALIVLDFGSDKSSSSGDFTIQWPAAATGTAIIRIGT
jgi:hypothetical protein